MCDGGLLLIYVVEYVEKFRRKLSQAAAVNCFAFLGKIPCQYVNTRPSTPYTDEELFLLVKGFEECEY